MRSEPNNGKWDAPGWFSTPHGRFVYFNGSWQYEYNLTDHASTSLSTGLGNVRAVFAVNQQGQVVLQQKTDYYPFGMVMNQTSPGTGPAERKLHFRSKHCRICNSKNQNKLDESLAAILALKKTW